MTDTAKSARDIIAETLGQPCVVYSAAATIGDLLHKPQADAIIAALRAKGLHIVATPAVGEVRGADAMDDEKLIAALRLRVKANAEYDIYVGRKPLKGTLDEQAADRLLSLREENARLRPPCTPEGLHEYSSLGCIAFFKTEADCDAFMKWLSDRDDEARAALTPPRSGRNDTSIAWERLVSIGVFQKNGV